MPLKFSYALPRCLCIFLLLFVVESLVISVIALTITSNFQYIFSLIPYIPKGLYCTSWRKSLYQLISHLRKNVHLFILLGPYSQLTQREHQSTGVNDHSCLLLWAEGRGSSYSMSRYNGSRYNRVMSVSFSKG